VNELVTGREEIFFGAEFNGSAGTHKLPAEVVAYYIDALASDPDALCGTGSRPRLPVPVVVVRKAVMDGPAEVRGRSSHRLPDTHKARTAVTGGGAMKARLHQPVAARDAKREAINSARRWLADQPA
jgi:hypothetical protein